MRTACTEGKWTICPVSRDGIIVGYCHIYYDYHHRFPDWMPLSMHLLVERMLGFFPSSLFRNRFFGPLRHLIHGLICAYSLSEITEFVRRQRLEEPT
jgi:hypothetical protein